MTLAWHLTSWRVYFAKDAEVTPSSQRICFAEDAEFDVYSREETFTEGIDVASFVARISLMMSLS